MLKLTNHRHWSRRKLKTNAPSPSQSERTTDSQYEDVAVESSASDVVFLSHRQSKAKEEEEEEAKTSRISGVNFSELVCFNLLLSNTVNVYYKVE